MTQATAIPIRASNNPEPVTQRSARPTSTPALVQTSVW